MKTIKLSGYVFPIVVVVVTLIITSLSITIFNQKKRIDIIENYRKLDIIEEEISAVELVILEYLNEQYIKSEDLFINSNFQSNYNTTSNGKISVELKISDDCFNINSLFYKNSNNLLEINLSEFERLKFIFKNLDINIQFINTIKDWIDIDNDDSQNLTEIDIYKNKNLDWRPRNNLAVSNIELFMMPGFLDNYKKLNGILCVNLYNRKINILNLSPIRISLLFPFLNIENSKILSEIIKEDFWPNSNPNIKTDKNVKNFIKEVEQLIGRSLRFSEKIFFENISFKSKSITAKINYENKNKEKYFSLSKFEVDSDIKVKMIYRYGPLRQDYINM